MEKHIKPVETNTEPKNPFYHEYNPVNLQINPDLKEHRKEKQIHIEIRLRKILFFYQSIKKIIIWLLLRK